MAKRIKVIINGVNVQMWKVAWENKARVKIAGEEAIIAFDAEGAFVDEGIIPVDIREELSHRIVQYFYQARPEKKLRV